MSFSTSLLMTPAECDVLLLHGQEKVRAATYQINVLTHSQQNATLTASQYNDELAGLNDDIATLTNRLPGMTEGAFKDDKINELRKKTDRRDELVARQKTEGAVALIKRELDLQQAQDALARANEMIAAVQARKAAL